LVQLPTLENTTHIAMTKVGRSTRDAHRLAGERVDANALVGDLKADAALRHVVARCRVDLIKYRAAVLATRRSTGVHQARVVLRRLRAALGLLGEVNSDAELPSLAAEARWLAGECAPSRDLYVFLKETVADPPRSILRIGARLASDHLSRARAALGGGERYAAFDRKLARFALSPPAQAGPDLKTFGRAALDAQYAKVRRRGRKLSSLKASELHRLRIAVKKLRYAEDFLQPGFNSKSARAYIQATARLQDVLGVLHDRAVAPELMSTIAAAARPSDEANRPLKRLAKQLKTGEQRDKGHLKRAWKSFRKAEPFWRA
jgi:CHAD domain-containing protein